MSVGSRPFRAPSNRPDHMLSCSQMTVLCFVCLVWHCNGDRVSSVLNKDVRQFGKKFMFDGAEDSCWNSDQVSITSDCIINRRHASLPKITVCCSQGTPQHVTLGFPSPVRPSELKLTFQGGFAGKKCTLLGAL